MSTNHFTEILNYQSAMSRDVGEMRARFDEVNTRFDEVRADIRHLARKVELLNQDSLNLRASQRDLEARMDNFDSKQP
ncbi:MAG: hypothetical protein H0W76_20425 [Pyrinomonadaceae bacterium]|nr:hypothetical protein [Pyrinomonadaceae bacterium]